MGCWDRLNPYLPSEWLAALERLPPSESAAVQELRLRVGQPLMLSTPTGERFLTPDGLTAVEQNNVYRCTPLQIETCFMRFCEESLYAHEQELRQGYVAVPGGIRVGVVGTAAAGDNTVRSVGAITALCVRLPRRHDGCATGLMPLVLEGDTLRSTLLVGEPSSGKTSLLRDLAARLAARRLRVTVVDERGELGGVTELPGCDVLRGYPKAVGIRQAIRCLAPQVVVFDELGEEEEQQAVAACAHAGVAVVASLHGHDPLLLGRKPAVRRLVEERVFDRWVFLAGRRVPGRWVACYRPEVMGDEIRWDAADGSRRGGPGAVLCSRLDPSGALSAADGTATGSAAAAADLHRQTFGSAVAGAGGWRRVR